MYVAFMKCHNPNNPSPNWKGKSHESTYLEALMELDDNSGKVVQAIRDAGAAVNGDILVICHGGPIAEPEDARFILERTHGVHGFFGASSIERLAVERAITEQTRRFKQIMQRRPA